MRFYRLHNTKVFIPTPIPRVGSSITFTIDTPYQTSDFFYILEPYCYFHSANEYLYSRDTLIKVDGVEHTGALQGADYALYETVKWSDLADGQPHTIEFLSTDGITASTDITTLYPGKEWDDNSQLI